MRQISGKDDLRGDWSGLAGCFGAPGCMRDPGEMARREDCPAKMLVCAGARTGTARELAAVDGYGKQVLRARPKIYLADGRLGEATLPFPGAPSQTH